MRKFHYVQLIDKDSDGVGGKEEEEQEDILDHSTEHIRREEVFSKDLLNAFSTDRSTETCQSGLGAAIYIRQ